MNKYFNLCGLTFVIVILIPNIVFSITCKDGFVNHYQNKLVETLEQIGRFGCFISMFFILPFIESAVVCGNLQLLIFAVLFAPCHILISYMNAIMK